MKLGADQLIPKIMIAVVGSRVNETNRALVAAWHAAGLEAALFDARHARRSLAFGDVALGRIDVLPTLDGVEPGLLDLLLLERSGVDVRNPVRGLLAAHDKLRTAWALHRAGIPHPRTAWVREAGVPLPLDPPLVLKPRFGGWGRAVSQCRDQDEARQALDAVAGAGWFRRHGVLAQELVPDIQRDLRVLVAGGRVVGAVTREAAAGEWRTNVSLGGIKRYAVPDAAASALAVSAALTAQCDLVAVDLLPRSAGGYVVLELNGAADFDDEYTPPGRSACLDVACALGVEPVRLRP